MPGERVYIAAQLGISVAAQEADYLDQYNPLTLDELMSCQVGHTL